MAAHDRHRLSRRRFLGAMGASAGAAALNPGGAAAAPGRPRRGARARVPSARALRSDLPAAAVRAAEPEGRGGAARAGQARRPARRQRPARGRAQAADRRPVAERQQPQQPQPHGGDDVLRPIPRPRHDLRCRLPARPADPATVGAQLPHADAGSGFGLRRRVRGPAGALRPIRPRQAQARERRPLRRPAPPRGRHGDHRRPAQRREPHHRGAALRLRRLPQPRHRPRTRRGAPRRGRRLRSRAPPDDLALPLARSSPSSCPRSSARTW